MRTRMGVMTFFQLPFVHPHPCVLTTCMIFFVYFAYSFFDRATHGFMVQGSFGGWLATIVWVRSRSVWVRSGTPHGSFAFDDHWGCGVVYSWQSCCGLPGTRPSINQLSIDRCEPAMEVLHQPLTPTRVALETLLVKLTPYHTARSRLHTSSREDMEVEYEYI